MPIKWHNNTGKYTQKCIMSNWIFKFNPTFFKKHMHFINQYVVRMWLVILLCKKGGARSMVMLTVWRATIYRSAVLHASTQARKRARNATRKQCTAQAGFHQSVNKETYVLKGLSVYATFFCECERKKKWLNTKVFSWLLKSEKLIKRKNDIDKCERFASPHLYICLQDTTS